jgi:hypothetical protein
MSGQPQRPKGFGITLIEGLLLLFLPGLLFIASFTANADVIVRDVLLDPEAGRFGTPIDGSGIPGTGWNSRIHAYDEVRPQSGDRFIVRIRFQDNKRLQMQDLGGGYREGIEFVTATFILSTGLVEGQAVSKITFIDPIGDLLVNGDAIGVISSGSGFGTGPHNVNYTDSSFTFSGIDIELNFTALTLLDGAAFDRIEVIMEAENIHPVFPDPVLLSDDFNSENGGNRQDIYSRFANWNVTDGSVDLRHRTDFGLTPPTDQVVDLDGGTLDAGRLESRAIFILDPGTTYELRFDLAGNQRTPAADTVTVSLGTVFSEDFTLSMFDPFTTVVREIVVTTPASGTLVFDHAGGDNIGLLLDNVHLIRKEASALVDHFLCYKAKGEPPYVVVDLEDEFGLLAGVFVEQPDFFCNPVNKNGEGILNPTAHLTCYKIRAENEKRDVVVDNQFGEQFLETQKAELLCVPSEVRP